MGQLGTMIVHEDKPFIAHDIPHVRELIENYAARQKLKVSIKEIDWKRRIRIVFGSDPKLRHHKKAVSMVKFFANLPGTILLDPNMGIITSEAK